MELSKRLQMNVSLIPKGARVGDIGCDHGYASIFLAREKACRVIAMDVREGPLSHARENILRARLSTAVECRLSDGLKGLVPGEVDTVLLGGMGGMLIASILERAPKVMRQIQTVVLQPQSDWRQVRLCLLGLGFVIDQEKFCVDAGKDYLAIRARRLPEIERGRLESPYTDAELTFGRYLPRHRDMAYRDYLERERDKYIAILGGLEGKSSGAEERTKELTHIINMLEEVLRQW